MIFNNIIMETSFNKVTLITKKQLHSLILQTPTQEEISLTPIHNSTQTTLYCLMLISKTWWWIIKWILLINKWCRINTQRILSKMWDLCMAHKVPYHNITSKTPRWVVTQTEVEPYRSTNWNKDHKPILPMTLPLNKWA